MIMLAHIDVPPVTTTCKPRVYVAGPYTTPDPDTNVRTAVRAADELLKIGCTPFVPHLTHLWNQISPKGWREWIDYDLEWVAACHALLRLPGVSPGAELEVQFALKMGIPVFHSLAEVDEWVRNLSVGSS